MLTLEQVRALLADRRLDKVSEATGLHRSTLARIRDGLTPKVNATTLKLLSDYLVPQA